MLSDLGSEVVISDDHLDDHVGIVGSCHFELGTARKMVLEGFGHSLRQRGIYAGGLIGHIRHIKRFDAAIVQSTSVEVVGDAACRAGQQDDKHRRKSGKAVSPEGSIPVYTP